jgi:hypothetical protein
MSSCSSDSSLEPNLPATITNPPLASHIQLINIKTHVPMVLDFTESNYGPYRICFLDTFTKYGLTDHINGFPLQGTSY